MTPSMSPPVRRRPSLFWPLTLLTLMAGLALCLYGSSLWLDLADPQLTYSGHDPDVQFSVSGWTGWAGGLAAVLLAVAVLIGLVFLLLVGLPLLLVTLEYDQSMLPGPPFSVDEDEVQRLYAPGHTVELLHTRDALAEESRWRERGLTWLLEKVYYLTAATGATS
jgi:hypothetical protein